MRGGKLEAGWRGDWELDWRQETRHVRPRLELCSFFLTSNNDLTHLPSPSHFSPHYTHPISQLPLLTSHYSLSTSYLPLLTSHQRRGFFPRIPTYTYPILAGVLIKKTKIRRITGRFINLKRETFSRMILENPKALNLTTIRSD